MKEMDCKLSCFRKVLEDTTMRVTAFGRGNWKLGELTRKRKGNEMDLHLSTGSSEAEESIFLHQEGEKSEKKKGLKKKKEFRHWVRRPEKGPRRRQSIFFTKADGRERNPEIGGGPRGGAQGDGRRAAIKRERK